MPPIKLTGNITYAGIYWLIEKGTTCIVIFYIGRYDIIVLK